MYKFNKKNKAQMTLFFIFIGCLLFLMLWIITYAAVKIIPGLDVKTTLEVFTEIEDKGNNAFTLLSANNGDIKNMEAFGYFLADGSKYISNVNKIEEMLKKMGQDYLVISHATRTFSVKTNFDNVIKEASKQYKVEPALIKAVIKKESDFDPRELSKVGAAALMQLMPQTAKDLGLNVPDYGTETITVNGKEKTVSKCNSVHPENCDFENDERFNVRKNIFAGTHYLKQMLDRFNNDKTLALAAYNAGPTIIEQHGGIPKEGWEETKNYVPKVMSYYAQYVTTSIGDVANVFGELKVQSGIPDTDIKLEWPTKPEFRKISSAYGMRKLGGKPDYHGGIDLATPVGTEIYAPADGEVVHVSTGCIPSEKKCTVEKTEECRCGHGSGNYLVIKHEFNGKIYYTIYAHLNQVFVTKGQTVNTGYLIGKSGNTGYSTGPHLHFELANGIEIRNNGDYVKHDKYSMNPCPYLGNPEGCSKDTEEVPILIEGYIIEIPVPGARFGNTKANIILG